MRRSGPSKATAPPLSSNLKLSVAKRTVELVNRHRYQRSGEDKVPEDRGQDESDHNDAYGQAKQTTF
jgi:hypothetical protein